MESIGVYILKVAAAAAAAVANNSVHAYFISQLDIFAPRLK
jgi:hypothetical protein